MEQSDQGSKYHPAHHAYNWFHRCQPQRGRGQYCSIQKGLAEAGYVEGRDVTIEYRPVAEEERLAEGAAELIRRRFRHRRARKHAGGPRGESRPRQFR